MDFTPILKLSLPPFDDIPWDEAINGNFSVIDAALGRFYSVPNLVGIWQNSTSYLVGQSVIDNIDSSTWSCSVSHTSAATPTVFASDRAAHPGNWTSLTATAQAYAIAAAASATAAANSAATAAATATTNVGRNLIHNSRFNIQQRGVGSWSTTGSYTADRWRMDFIGGTMTCSIGTFFDVDRALIGDESAISYLGAAVIGGGAAGDSAIVSQYHEGTTRLSGRTITISFWANSSVNGSKLGIGVRQFFGTGGSPSASVDLNGQSVTLNTTLARYSVSFAVPSTSGKVFGTAVGTSYTRIAFCLSSGTSSAVIFGSPGVQTMQVSLYGVQLEVGGAATAFEQTDRFVDLGNCQRFYTTGVAFVLAYTPSIGGFVGSHVTLPTTMRIVPAITIGGAIGSDINVSTAIGDSAQGGSWRFVVSSTAAGPVSASRFYIASSEF